MRRIAKTLIGEHAFDDREVWREACMDLWDGARFREERYIAIELLLARRYATWRTFDIVPLAEHFIVTGAWWDYVDSVAPTVFGDLLLDEPARTATLLRRWCTDDDIWKRRATLIAQLRLKKRTDEALLFELIEPSLASKEFFLRKAIGWALREYSKTAPTVVARYVQRERARLSPLSRREAMKVIERNREERP
jgi:3-methyladenine DNA glycosylase AlkD